MREFRSKAGHGAGAKRSQLRPRRRPAGRTRNEANFAPSPGSFSISDTPPGIGGGTVSKRRSTLDDLWTIPVEACAIVGVIPRPAATERVLMATIPQRIASAFAVLCGRYGDVT